MSDIATSRTFHLIVNPASGGGKAGRKATGLIASLRAGGCDVQAEFTRSLEHGTELARTAAATGATVVAVGGDGLVSSVINGVMTAAGSSSGPTAAIVPMGTGNDFARSLGITDRNALDVLARHDVRSVDLGHVETEDFGARYFTCIASLGFDSDVIESAMRTRLVKGPLVYPYATLKCLVRWKPATFSLNVDGVDETIFGFSAAVSNSGVFGGGMRLAPDADLTDGLLDVVTVARTSKVHFLHHAPRIFSGTHVKSRHIGIRHARRVTMDVDRAFMVYADGEPVGRAPATIEVRPAAVRMVAPSEKHVEL